jgi:hypothetical protein
MNDAINNFARQFCGNSNPDVTAEVMQTNYETCWRLAQQWAELVDTHYLNAEANVGAEIWERNEALRATEVAARLYTAGLSADHGRSTAWQAWCGLADIGAVYSDY